MPSTSTLAMLIEKRDVALHYPGAEGVTFQDAVFVVKNNGTSPVREVVFSLRIYQEGKMIFEGDVRPSLLGIADLLDVGESLRMSVFRVLLSPLPRESMLFSTSSSQSLLHSTLFATEKTMLRKSSCPEFFASRLISLSSYLPKVESHSISIGFL